MPESCPLWIVVAVLIQRAGLPQADINNIQCHCFYPTCVVLTYKINVTCMNGQIIRDNLSDLHAQVYKSHGN